MATSPFLKQPTRNDDGMKPSILLVGNFLSATGRNRAVGEELADRLKSSEYSITLTSNKSSRILRLLDMSVRTWIKRTDYDVAYVEVFSGAAFLWAEVVTGILQLVQLPTPGFKRRNYRFASGPDE